MNDDTEAVLLGTNLSLPAEDGRHGSATVHLLPCAIEHDGPARVSDYFRPREVALAEGATGKEATLRVRRASFSHL